MSFAYIRPDTIETARALAASGGRILAGGQSLMPLVNRGDVRPATLVDINRLDGLDGIRRDAGVIEIGALARLEAVRLDPLVREHLPLLAAALAWVANPAIRQRGTLVGNVMNDGPGAEAVAVARLMHATLLCAAPGGTVERDLGAGHDGQLALALRVPCSPAGTRAGFHEVQRRFGHLGLLGAGVMQAPGRGVEIVLSGLLDQPLIASHVAAAVTRGCTDDAALDAALALDLACRRIRDDLHATARYRRDVAPAVIRRALAQAGLGGGCP